MAYNNHPENSADRFSLSDHGSNFSLSENFNLIEFASKDGADEVLVHPALIEGLEEIRKHFGLAIFVTSGYRTESHNRKVKGVANSRHKFGLAADIMIKGVQPHKIAQKAESLGFGGIGRYRTFTHVDVFRSNRRWKGKTLK